MPDFVFATCRAGSEAALKREVAARHGDLLTPAFMRPQLVTWKAREAVPPEFQFVPVFGAVSGRSSGPARSIEEVVDLAGNVSDVHVFPRLIPEDGLAAAQWLPLDDLRRQILQRIPPHAGDWILDVIVGEGEEPWFVGRHQRSPHAHTSAGALPRLTLPPEAPSRAWLKMESALTWAGVDSLEGKVVLELGSSPGGGTWSLLNRGARVFGVDTGAMDARVAASSNFVHLAMPAGEVPMDSLPNRVDVIASDMNLEPNLVLDYVRRLAARLRPRLLILTLKMNDAKVEARVPAFLEKVRRLGLQGVRAKQLPANRRDICVLAGSLA